jgi:histidinol-phosphate aminotransferase
MNAPSRPEKSRPEAKAGILDIQPYVPGKSKLADPNVVPVKLSSNENVLGSSPHAIAAHVEAASRLNVYPDSRNNALRAAIAEHFRLEPERLVFGCGSDEIFAILNQVYLEPGDNIVMGQYGFSAYAIGARACQAQVRFADEPKLTTHVDNMLALVDERTRLVFFANPSNPTGTFLGDDEVRRLHAGLPGDVILVIDGAYSEFCDAPEFSDGLDLARTAENVIVTRTFSKLHGLAALRVGWAYAPEPVVAALDRIRLPFNVVLPGQDAAIAALADQDFQDRSLALVKQWRPWLVQQLGGLGLDVVPSQANFVLVGFPKAPDPRGAAEAEAWLADRGWIVRGVKNYGLPDHLRITIGLEPHNRAMVEALAAFMKG